MNDLPSEGGTLRMPRRRFLKIASFGLTGGALLAAGGWGVASAWMPGLLSNPLLRSSFAPYLGDAFSVRSDVALPAAVQLVDIRDLHVAAQADSDGEHNFALTFRGPLEQPLAQGTYGFTHGRMGDFALFIVPMAAEPEARYYEAIFNRQQA